MFKPLQQARPQLYRSRSGSPPLPPPSQQSDQSHEHYTEYHQQQMNITPQHQTNKKMFYYNNSNNNNHIQGNYSSTYNDSKYRFTTTSSPKSPAACNLGYKSKYSNATTATTTATSKFINKISTSPHSLASALKNAQQIRNQQQFFSSKLSKVAT